MDKVKVICYGKEETWENRKDAIKFYKKGMRNSYGSEQRRYEKIVDELEAGYEVATDRY